MNLICLIFGHKVKDRFDARGKNYRFCGRCHHFLIQHSCINCMGTGKVLIPNTQKRKKCPICHGKKTVLLLMEKEQW